MKKFNAQKFQAHKNFFPINFQHFTTYKSTKFNTKNPQFIKTLFNNQFSQEPNTKNSQPIKPPCYQSPQKTHPDLRTPVSGQFASKLWRNVAEPFRLGP